MKKKDTAARYPSLISTHRPASSRRMLCHIEICADISAWHILKPAAGKPYCRHRPQPPPQECPGETSDREVLWTWWRWCLRFVR